MDQDSGSQEAQGQGRFAIHRVYLKDVSLETPNSPAIFRDPWKPDVSMNLSSETKSLETDTYEVVLSVTVTVKLGERTAYLVEVQQAGIFGAQGFEQHELNRLLGSYCPNLLFPFAREAVSDLVIKGGFPQLLLAPVNFDALYAQHLQRAQQQRQGDGSAH